MSDELDAVGAVADAVLFEGYVLYPYRASARKNQLRWQFGVLTPRSWADEHGETSASRTECLLEPGEATDVRIRLRFLRLRRRQVQRAGPRGYADVPELSIGHELHVTWDEAVPEVVDARFPLAALLEREQVVPVELAAGATEEPLWDGRAPVGRLVRQTWPLRARVVAGAEPVPGPYAAVRLRVRVENLGTEPAGERDTALRHSLIGAHSILALTDGLFLSCADPPEWARPAVAACVNEHVWPVLAGDPERPRAVLSSPIIMADFPEIAPESPNELYDGTENDEILTLRTMALTDAEKREARATDPRAAALVDAVDHMPPEILERLHGVIRSMSVPGPEPGPASDQAPGAGPAPTFGEIVDRLDEGVPTYCDDTGGKPWWDPGRDASVDPETDSVFVGRHRVAKGTRVVLRPSGRADAQDFFLAGRDALVEAVLHDVDGDVHLAVSLVDDPAAEFHAAHGRYRYFRPDEVEVST